MSNFASVKELIREMKTEPKGIKKITNKAFIDICKFEKCELKGYLKKELKKYYKRVISKDGFLYATSEKLGNKIVLTAHMDTTPSVDYGKRKMVKDVYEYEDENGNTIVHSPQGIGGDDRCGVYMIMEILKRTELRPTIVFCEDEEIGSEGSDKFVRTEYIDELRDKLFVIELDRRGSNDAVFYDDDNLDFQRYIQDVTGYELEFGSFSDICNICPECGVSGVNLSCGYYNEHHAYEKVCLEEMERTLNTTINLIRKGIEDNIRFEYEERRYTYKYDWMNQLERYEYKNNEIVTIRDRVKEETFTYYLTVEFDNYYGDCGIEDYQGDSIADVWYQFLSSHPNLTMNDVVDYQEWSDADYFTKAE